MAVTPEPRNGKLVVEIPYELLDDTWTERDLIDNAADYLTYMIYKAEQRNHAEHPDDIAYTLDSDITVWTLGAYTEDLNDLAEANMKGELTT